jgi:pilus assembly protein CpaD
MRYVMLALLVLTAGCETYYADDYRERFPVVVQRQTPVLLVSFVPNRTELAPDEAARLDTFLAGFAAQNSGSLKLTAQHGAPTDRLALDRLAALQGRAVAAGIPKSRIELGFGERQSSAGDVVASFEYYTAQVPDCGDWSKNTAIDWTNTPSSNFGCATQRYIGLMAADPQDLLRGQAIGSHDDAKLADTLVKYRSGAPTVAAKQDPTLWKGFFDPSTAGVKSQQ